MKITTILKVAATVATVCVAVPVVYSKLKVNDVQEVEPTVDEAEDGEEPDNTAKEIIVPATIAAVTMFAGLMLSPIAIYNYSLRKLAQKAIDNGNLTFEELVRLANNVSQEVA